MNSLVRSIITIVITLSVLLLSSCGKPAVETKNGAVQAVDVRTETVKPSRLIDGIQVAGTVKAFEDANMAPEEGGVVKAWAAAKGQQVKKGDMILLLKDEVLKAGFDAAEAQYKMAELNLEKQRKVYSAQGISELALKNFEYTRDAARANADLMKARWERTQLRSPINGVVDNIMPNVGDFAPPGVPVARVVNTAMIKIQADVPELYSGSVPVGTQAVIWFDALPGDTLRGKVSFVSSTVSSANRSLTVEIALTNPYRKIKPEMVAKVILLREVKTNAILVSDNVVQLVDRNRSIVFVENGGKAVERQLQLGGRQGNMVEVLDGLKAGDHLIVLGYQKVVDGTPVHITQ